MLRSQGRLKADATGGTTSVFMAFARARLAVVCLSLRRAVLALLLAPFAAASATEAPNLGRAAVVDQKPYQVLIGPREHWDCGRMATACAIDLPAVKSGQQLKLTLCPAS